MALPTSGTITAAMINVELGRYDIVVVMSDY